MLGYLRRRIWERSRLIFRYWDGTAYRRADPLKVFRALESHPTFNWEVHPALCDQDDPEALEITTAAVREVFGIPEFDDRRGLTEAELLLLLTEFAIYCDWIKKKHSIFPTWQSPTEPPSSEESTTPPSLDSGCASAEPTPAEALP